jgi:hypothetical protein
VFSKVDAGTQIDVNTEHHLIGALVPLSFFLRWPAHRRIKRKLARFKEAIEGGARDAATKG